MPKILPLLSLILLISCHTVRDSATDGGSSFYPYYISDFSLEYIYTIKKPVFDNGRPRLPVPSRVRHFREIYVYRGYVNVCPAGDTGGAKRQALFLEIVLPDSSIQIHTVPPSEMDFRGNAIITIPLQLRTRQKGPVYISLGFSDGNNGIVYDRFNIFRSRSFYLN